MGEVGAQQQPGQPGGGSQGHHRDLDEGLQRAGAAADLAHGARGDGGGALLSAPDVLGEGAEARVVVEIPHGHGGVALADAAHERRGGQGGAAQGEEVRVLVGDGNTEGLDPQLGKPLFGLGKPRGFHTNARQWPRQGLLVHLAGGADGQLLHHTDARDQGRRHGLSETIVRGLLVEALCFVLEGHIAHQHGFAAWGLLHGHGRVIDVGQRGDVGLDLTELDAAAANLDLVVHAAHEVKAVLFQAHVVAGAVGALPRHRLQRRVLFRVLGWVQVAGESHATDDEFADLAEAHGEALLVDDHQVPAVQRQTDGHGVAWQHALRAGHDGGLGRAVGIPHLTVIGCQAIHQFLGAGFAADDEQANVVECLGWPQARQGRDGGHDGDVAADEPGA